jgi:phosphoglycerate dehydrogenase-like enzyme
MFPELLASHVVITSARGIRARSIAEHVIGVTIALARRLPVALRAQAAHRWAQDELEGPGSGIRLVNGSRMAIVGFGSIGSAVAALAAPLGMRISAIRRRVAGAIDGVDEVLPPERLDEVLAKSDVIVLALPHTPDTKQIIGRRELDRIKRGALLVNIARGKLVDDAAVVDALKDGRLGGAALDVFTREPLDPASPYWDLPNVIVTPHNSVASAGSDARVNALFLDNLQRWADNRPLINEVKKPLESRSLSPVSYRAPLFTRKTTPRARCASSCLMRRAATRISPRASSRPS